jgi:hypothetical protein
MGGLMSLNKGKRGEREVVKLLQAVVDKVHNEKSSGLDCPRLQRNTLQSDKGGFDIVGLDWLAVEVKYHETLAVKQWWQQTVKQAKPGQQPVLFYRKSRSPWHVVTLVQLPGSGRMVKGTVDLDCFLQDIEEQLLFKTG